MQKLSCIDANLENLKKCKEQSLVNILKQDFWTCIHAHTHTPKLQVRSGSTLLQNLKCNIIWSLNMTKGIVVREERGRKKWKGGWWGGCYDVKPLEGKSLKWWAILWRLLLVVCKGRKTTQMPHHFGVAERPFAMMPSFLLAPPWWFLFSKLPI
jgi:hypothetical protein